MPRPAPKPPSSVPSTVSGRWLLKAIGAVILMALLCSYVSLMLLYSVGQWQLVLHPDKKAQQQPAPPGLIRFGPDESGRPQLTGEWFAAPSNGRYANRTILILPSGDGSRNDLREVIAALHEIGINVFSFDYRGYGLSASVHPNQHRMMEDAESAWQYLVGTRGVAANSIVPYGVGVGASVATRLATEHRDISMLILDSARGDLLETAIRDSRSALLPARWLFHERFPLSQPLAQLDVAKLLITRGEDQIPSSYQTAAQPKQAVRLPASGELRLQDIISPFLDMAIR